MARPRGINPALSPADKTARQLSARNAMDDPVCKNPATRKRLEKHGNEQKWLKHYLAQTYTRPFEKPHIEIIESAMKVSATGQRLIIAAERGIGKSAILWGVLLYLVLTGRQPFPVCVPWAASALKRAFNFWKNAVSFNQSLYDDYPEFCMPFHIAKGVPQRVLSMTWKRTGKNSGAQLTVGEGVIAFPDQRGCLGGSTINGNIRGLNHPQQDGTILRPSIVMLDDIQDRKVAKSTAQVSDTVAIIDGDIAGCGEAGRDLPILAACNCITADDVPAHYMADDGWESLKIPCILSFPDKFFDPDSESKALWDDWHEKFRHGTGDVAFYKENKNAMTKGMELSAPAVFKGAKKCPDAFYGVMRQYYKMGHMAFMAERQQEPINPIDELGPYTLTPAIVQSRADKTMKQFEIPDWVVGTVASTDINPSRAMSSVILSMGADQTAVIPWYGLHKCSISGDMSAPEFNRRLYEQLSIHGKALAGLPVKPDAWAIDAGGKQFDGVVRFVKNSARICGIPAYAFTGRGAKNYRQTGKTAVGPFREMVHGCLDRKKGVSIRWVPWNADYWKDNEQTAWLGEVGSPGSVALYAGEHTEFCLQICGDKLLGRGEIGGQMIWNFHRVPGYNDFGDALAQAYALHAYMGIGTGGRMKTRRRASVVISGKTIKQTTGETKHEEKDETKAEPKCRAVIGRRG